MKKISILLIIAALCFSFASCGGDRQSADEVLKEAEDMMNDYDDDYQDAVDNWREQSKKMDELIAEYKSQN